MTDEERKQRIHHHMYTTCEGIAEHAERIVALEELCADMHTWMGRALYDGSARKHEYESIESRMDELGVQH